MGSRRLGAHAGTVILVASLNSSWSITTIGLGQLLSIFMCSTKLDGQSLRTDASSLKFLNVCSSHVSPARNFSKIGS